MRSTCPGAQAKFVVSRDGDTEPRAVRRVPDGQRFLMIRERGATTPPTAVYMENWLTELTAKMKR